jgi:hypothetical protein
MPGAEELPLHGLAERVRRFAVELTREYGYSSGLRDRVWCVLRECLPKKSAGRPALDDVTQAIKLRSGGVVWKQIYPLVIPCYSSLSGEQCQYKQRELRDRVRNRLYSQRKRLQTSAGESS